MSHATVSSCGRFVTIHDVELDRDVFDAFARWANERGFCVKHAIQLALFSLEPVIYATRRKPPRRRAPRRE